MTRIEAQQSRPVRVMVFAALAMWLAGSILTWDWLVDLAVVSLVVGAGYYLYLRRRR